MKKLIALAIAFGLVALAFMDVDAAHQGTTCQVGTSAAVRTSDDPDTFRAVAYTRCTLPPEFPDPPDQLTLSVFWKFADWRFQPYVGGAWLKAHWADGGVYDLVGCVECATITSRSNDDVPISPFGTLNCRKAVTVHQIVHHLTTTPPLYFWTETDAVCQ